MHDEQVISVDELEYIVSFKISSNLLDSLDRKCAEIKHKRSRVIRALIYLFVNDDYVFNKAKEVIDRWLV